VFNKAYIKGYIMKNVQISLDENLLETVDQLAASNKTSRSAVVREALKHWIKDKEIEEFENQWIRSIKQNPDESKNVEVWKGAQHWSEP
jgi:metal-responsive CopG/Arc/MetJ family transcriptional regulator